MRGVVVPFVRFQVLPVVLRVLVGSFLRTFGEQDLGPAVKITGSLRENKSANFVCNGVEIEFRFTLKI